MGGACVLLSQKRVVREASCVAMVTRSLPGAGAEEVLGRTLTVHFAGEKVRTWHFAL